MAGSGRREGERVKIAIVGARERDTEEDRQLVGQLMERLDVEAPRSTFISTLTHIGVGRFVKEKMLGERRPEQFSLLAD